MWVEDNSSALSTYGEINSWDTSLITDMSNLFMSWTGFYNDFNDDISNWDVSNVTNMHQMFYKAHSFNQPLNNWDVSNVVNMQQIFDAAHSFNQNLSDWDVSSVTNMRLMFHYLYNFNQDLSSWNVSNVTNMTNMFSRAGAFNGDISSWDVSSVTNMRAMFKLANNFNQDISSWDVSNVTDMHQMFVVASQFNQDISSWDVSSVTDMANMFVGASQFNQDISSWDVANVTTMENMFTDTDALSQQNQCSIHTSFSTNDVWPYDWSGNCDDDGDGVINFDEIAGCQDTTACNYDTDATDDDGSCSYPEENFDCNGNCTATVDCAGVCDGTSTVDCAGTCGGTLSNDLLGVCGGDGSLQGAIDVSNTGDQLIVPGGTYNPIFITKSITLECALDSECLIDASGSLTGIVIGDALNSSFDVSDVTVRGFTITGDAFTNAGILVAPRTSNITITENNISGMQLPNPANDSPLSYGILTYGGPNYMPTNLTFSNNTISNVSGSGISLGSNTMNVNVFGNVISNIIPVLLENNPFSVAVQAQAAIGFNISENSFNGSPDFILASGMNIIASVGTVSNNSCLLYTSDAADE